jgi:hypothetical protein
MDLHSRPQVPILNRFMDGYGRDRNKLIPTPSDPRFPSLPFLGMEGIY